MTSISSVAARRKAPNSRNKQPRRLADKFRDFETGSFMYLGDARAVLWNNAAAMRRNGYRPSGVAAFLHREFGIKLHDDGAVPAEAMAFFERLVVADGAQAPSLLREPVRGQA